MKRFKVLGAAVLGASLLLAGCSGDDGKNGATGPQGPAGVAGAAGANGADGANGQDATDSTIALSVLGSFTSGLFDESASEIVAYDAQLKYAYVVNAAQKTVDIIDATAPSAFINEGVEAPVKTLNVAQDVENLLGLAAGTLTEANSVSVHGETLAVVIQGANKQANGYLAFYSTDGTFLDKAFQTGALPDMVTFTPDGSMVLVANEGEPNGDYSVDPEGSVTAVDMTAGVANLTEADVTQISFADYNVGGSRTLGEGVRISAKSRSVAADLEPEYIAVSADSSNAFVALQENSAVAVIDLASLEVTQIVSLGVIDHSIPGNELDASNRDGAVNIRTWPVFGTPMPDTIASYTYNGTTYLVTANEGDGREYLTDAVDAADCTAQGGFDFDGGDCFHYLDEIRIKDIDAAAFGGDLLARLPANFQDNEQLGRLKVITNLGTSGACASLATTGQPDAADCVYESLHSFGGRSFSIYNTETWERVYNSGNSIESVTANRLGVANFNSTNDENGSGDDRSDDKGPEPEAIEIGVIEGKTYVFVGLERVGGIAVYDISNPEQAEFVQYINNRDFDVADVEAATLAGAKGLDLGPESIKFVPAADSATGEAMLIVGNEVSGSTTFYSVTVTNKG